MTQRRRWIRFALPAMVGGRDGFRLTGELAKPNAVLEQIWNTLRRSAWRLPSHTSTNCHLRNSSTSIGADNPSHTTYFAILFGRPLSPARWDELTKGREMECLD